MKNDNHRDIYMNTEVVLPVHRTFFQIYNNGDIARKQLEDDYKEGHVSDERYASILKVINSPGIGIWSYTSARTGSKVVGVYRNTSMLTKRVNMNALLVLYCDVLEHVLGINNLKMAEVYDSHWFTYLAETIFTFLIPLYVSDKHTYTLKKQTHMEHEYTVYNTNVITVLSTSESDVKREYPDYIDPLLLRDAEAAFSNTGIQGMCLRETVGTQQAVCVKINTAPSPYGYIETMATLIHELVHSVANLIRQYEEHAVVTRCEVLFRQLITAYVYWIMMNMCRQVWGVEDKVIPEPTPEPPTGQPPQLLLPIDTR